MIARTVVVVGPGGVGKSPLDALFRDDVGKVEIVVLNPAPESVMVAQDWKRLESKTEENCTERGDSSKSIRDRVRSIAKEALAWKQLILENAATEYCDWEFPEYLYKRLPPGVSMIEHQKQMLNRARDRLCDGNPDLDEFFKDEGQIKQIKEPFVK